MSYYEERKKRAEDTVEALSDSLPPICAQWLKDRNAIKTPTAAVSYGRTMLLFFRNYAGRSAIDKPIQEYTIKDIEGINKDDIELFLSDITSYQVEDGQTHENNSESLRTKLSTVRSFFSYLVNNDYIEEQPFSALDKSFTDSLTQSTQLVCGMEDIQKFLQTVYSSGELLKKDTFSQKYSVYEHERLRDITMMELLVATGIPLSNLVSLDINDYSPNAPDGFVLSVASASGEREKFELSESAKNSLNAYIYGDIIGCRKEYNPESDERAMFISRKTHKRISVRTVQYIMREYSALAFDDGRIITPRMIRKTVKKGDGAE